MKRHASPLFTLLVFMIALVSRSILAAQYQGVQLFALPKDFGLSVGSLNSSSIQGGQVVGVTSTSEATTATIWKAPTGAPTDLHPAGFSYSQANGTDGIRQVGFGLSDDPESYQQQRALVWTGTAGSVVDLHPTDFYISTANDVSGSEQVGWGSIPAGYIRHALLWYGSADSVVDLHPASVPGYGSSEAVSTDGIQQVGFASLNTLHATLWSGSAASFIDLHPASGYVGSVAWDVMNGQQVGRGELNDTYQVRALLWTGSAESVINLNPTNLSPWGYLGSVALGTNGVQQVGWGQPFTSEITFGMQGALLWSGTADSAVDLHSLLPSGFVASQAQSIDATGVIWGFAMDQDFQWYAVMWAPVPEPSSSLLAIMGIAAISKNMHRRRIRALRPAQ